MQRKMMMVIAGLTMALFLTTSAQALSLSVLSAKKAKVTQMDADTIVYKGKRNKKNRATFLVSLGGSSLPAVTAGGDTDIDLLIVKLNGKKKRRTITVTGDPIEFTLKNKRRVVMNFAAPSNGVPEPGTLAMLGLGLAGLTVAGRQRSRA